MNRRQSRAVAERGAEVLRECGILWMTFGLLDATLRDFDAGLPVSIDRLGWYLQCVAVGPMFIGIGISAALPEDDER